MSVAEHIRIARLAADRSRRSVISRILYLPVLRWRFGAPTPAQLLIVPQDLRTADPSFWREIELGQFGLAGTIADLKGLSPFELPPPNAGWARALHGFGWLRHLEAAGHENARQFARNLAVEWIRLHQNGKGIAWDPAVAGRRLISWVTHAGLLLDSAEPKTYEAITQSLATQLIRLSASWREGADGHPRLLALIAVVLADLSIAGHDPQLVDAEQALTQELTRQLLPDGGHVSRNPSILVDLMLDLLPLQQCFKSRDRKPPETVLSALRRMPAMLRFLRLGDGTLGRFNGMSVALPAGLATVLAYDERQDVLPGLAPNSRYVRLSRGTSIVLMDAGGPPPLNAAAEAHAGCLSLEFSSGTRAIFVNGGAPGPAEIAWRPISRATASHNTLCLGGTSSSQLVRDSRLEQLIGAPAIKDPQSVEAHVADASGALEATASHDGYRSRFGLIHTRRLLLAADGRTLTGSDRLSGQKVRVRLREDVPFAIHFHLHPDVSCRPADRHSADITLKDGQTWRLSAENVAVSVEDSTHFADSAGPRRSLQIVLRGSTFGETEIAWMLAAMPQ